MKTGLVTAASVDPWFNMAVEEYLVNRVSDDEIILYLWQVEKTIMVGKHQNLIKECRCEQFEREGGRLARRLSGGGAVFQDLGTLMFSFISGRKLYDLDRQLQTVLHAVNSFGINAEFSGRNDLTVQGKKFSGNAFYFKSRSSLHHGTLLVNSDLAQLARYLTVSKEKIASKGVDSVQSRVVNLSEVNGGIAVKPLVESLQESFVRHYGGQPEERQVPRTAEIEQLYRKHSSWEWVYGNAPGFDIAYEGRFPWGGMEIGLRIADGLVTSAVVYSDAMDCDLAEIVAAALQNAPFRKDALLDRLRACADASGKQAFIEDVIAFLGGRLAG